MGLSPGNSLCKHEDARPWISMPFDVKTDRETRFGDLWWCPSCESGFASIMPDEASIWEHHSSLPRYHTHGDSHMPDVAPTFLDRLLMRTAWAFDHGSALDVEALTEHAEPPGQALDIGCGAGSTLQLLSRAGFDPIGLEPDRVARRTARASGFPVADGTAERLPSDLKERRFRLVVMTHVLEHCRRPQDALENVRDLLAPDGAFYCEVPNCGSIYFKRYAQISEMLDVPRHLHFFTRVSLRRLCDVVGLKVLNWRYHGFTRHYHPSWRAWENSIHDRLVEREIVPTCPRRSVSESLRLLYRACRAAPERKYDSIGFFACRA